MSKEVYREELQQRLAALDARLVEAQTMVARGTPTEKVDAAGELARLLLRRGSLAEKLTQLDREPESRWENAKAELEEDYHSIISTLEQLIGEIDRPGVGR